MKKVILTIVCLLLLIISYSNFEKNDETKQNEPEEKTEKTLVFVLSSSCFFKRPLMSLYNSCKVGLMGFAQTLQQEYAENKIKTVIVYPGRMNTSFREISNEEYMKPTSVANAIFRIVSLPKDIMPHEFVFRPQLDTYY